MIEGFGDPQDSVLVDFSQGAIMALHAVANGLPVRTVFALSDRLAGPIAARTAWPPITLLHGSADPMISARMAVATEAWLRAAGAVLDLRLFDGLAHGLDSRVLLALGDQLT